MDFFFEDHTFAFEQVNVGQFDPNDPRADGQVNLATQYAAAMSYPTPLFFYSTGGNVEWALNGWPLPGDMYLEWFDHIFDMPELPQTISFSYGESELGLPVDYAYALCELFAQLGSRGVSVLVASGSEGVGAGECINGEGNVRFIPVFPSSCPWVTSVGGTTGFPEVAASLSGGGFSEHFIRAWYQFDAVNEFLRNFHGHVGLFNFTGRGFPDIAAQALNYQFVFDGSFVLGDGTGCSVSTVAGIISMLNDFLISHNRPPLGFLNPWLYGIGIGGLKDIIEGSNPGCDTPGFPAVPGWDPVTGLGTLNFSKMLGNLNSPAPFPGA